MIGVKIKMFKNSLESEKGVAVLYVIFVAGIVLAIVLGISTILMYQAKMMREAGNSVVAFYAADSCIERALAVSDLGSPEDFNIDLNPIQGISCDVSVVPGDDLKCDGDTFCIRSVGIYRGTNRAIEISY